MKVIILQAVCYLITFFLLIIESIVDLKRKEVNIAVLSVGFAAGILLFVLSPNRNWIMLFGGIIEGLFLLTVSFVTREGIGKGDGYLILCTGILLGARKNLVMFFFACALCSIVSAVLILMKKAGRNTRIPFVPFLIPGFILMFMVGV